MSEILQNLDAVVIEFGRTAGNDKAAPTSFLIKINSLPCDKITLNEHAIPRIMDCRLVMAAARRRQQKVKPLVGRIRFGILGKAIYDIGNIVKDKPVADGAFSNFGNAELALIVKKTFCIFKHKACHWVFVWADFGLRWFRGNLRARQRWIWAALIVIARNHKCDDNAGNKNKYKQLHSSPLAYRVAWQYSGACTVCPVQGIGLPVSCGAARASRLVKARFLMVGRVVSTFGCAVPQDGKTNHGTSGHQGIGLPALDELCGDRQC